MAKRSYKVIETQPLAECEPVNLYTAKETAIKTGHVWQWGLMDAAAGTSNPFPILNLTNATTGTGKSCQTIAHVENFVRKILKAETERTSIVYSLDVRDRAAVAMVAQLLKKKRAYRDAVFAARAEAMTQTANAGAPAVPLTPAPVVAAPVAAPTPAPATVPQQEALIRTLIAAGCSGAQIADILAATPTAPAAPAPVAVPVEAVHAWAARITANGWTGRARARMEGAPFDVWVRGFKPSHPGVDGAAVLITQSHTTSPASGTWVSADGVEPVANMA